MPHPKMCSDCNARDAWNGPFTVLREEVAPAVLNEFLKGNFVVTKSVKLHSAMAIDQAHEQHNAVIKSTSDGMELLNRDDDEEAILRAIVSLPEVIRIKKEYECKEEYEYKETKLSKEHHESYSSFRKCFLSVVQIFLCIQASFNPFCETEFIFTFIS